MRFLSAILLATLMGIALPARAQFATSLRDDARLAAEQKDPEAAYRLGVRYYVGLEAPQDYEKAIRWFRSAAERNHAVAQLNLGLMLDDGYGAAVPRQPREAFVWLSLSAEAGNADARERLEDLRRRLDPSSLLAAERRLAAQRRQIGR